MAEEEEAAKPAEENAEAPEAAAATGDAAACMQVSDDLGTLAMGNWADFVVLSANPLDDILNTRSIESVWIAGNLVPTIG